MLVYVLASRVWLLLADTPFLVAQAKQMISSGGLSLNDKKLTESGYKLSEQDLLGGKVAILRAGKSGLKVIEIV